MSSYNSFGLYIHIPYCRKKCPYCDFNTYAVSKVPETEYVAGLCKELENYARDPLWNGREIRTIFFGGGTPSLLSGKTIEQFLKKVRDLFSLKNTLEISIEANPETLSKENIISYLESGINRFSLGAQSFNPKTLHDLGRDHSSESTAEAISLLKLCGAKNVSIDILFGGPEQSVENLESDITYALNLPLEHISAYGLTIEKGTPYFQAEARGALPLPSEEDVITMMDMLEDRLTSSGFEQYEISNFAKSGFNSIHNEGYWTGYDFIGLGAGAHNYWRDKKQPYARRWANVASPSDYVQKVESAPSQISWTENLDKKKLMFEFFYLGLRRLEGVLPQKFGDLFEVSPFAIYGEVIDSLVDKKLIEISNEHLRLTRQGRRLSDSVFSNFVI